MVTKKRGLGRGLEALLGSEKKPAQGAMLDELPIEWIKPGKFQPRKTFNEQALKDLAASIRNQGLVQPIVVREIGPSTYEIIAGERRWRAAQKAEMIKIPAIIKQVDDKSVVAMSLIENVQREDLNPIEQAQALQRLVEDFDLTHQQVADAVGKSRVAVTNYLRLNNLGSNVQAMLATGSIEMGHARALLGLPDSDQETFARNIVQQHMTVREVERAIQKAKKPPLNKAAKSSDTRHLETKLSAKIGQPVGIQHTKKGSGKLIISYNDLDELDGILRHFGDLE